MGEWDNHILRARAVSIRFGPGEAVVDRAELSLPKGKITALVGESGSGKSLIAHAMMGILTPKARLDADMFSFAGVDIRDADPSTWWNLRGSQIAMIFQNPRSALSPVRRVGTQIADVIARHRGLRGAALDAAVVKALEDVRIVDAPGRARAYPGELSGGMCQRVMIATALACNPSLLIADEPTTGLDTTTQAAILDLIVTAAAERRMACLLITHDLALAQRYADRVIVMHAGQIVEASQAGEFFAGAQHPYSRALLGTSVSKARTIDDLGSVPGSLPDLRGHVPACRYAGRCPHADQRCISERPGLVGRESAQVACWKPLS